jgi:isopentenyl phosphate kinase
MRRLICSEPTAQGTVTAAREVVLVKLGGSLLTDKRGEERLRRETLERLAKELVTGGAHASSRVILGHGSGSFGHRAAQRGGLGEPPSRERAGPRREAAAATQDRAAALHHLVIGALLAAGAKPFSFSPSSAFVASAGRLDTPSITPLLAALQGGLLPVCYGDVVLDNAYGAIIVSTERLFTLLAAALPEAGITLRRIVWLGATVGVLDHSGSLIPHLDAERWQAEESAITGAAGVDVTGGMRLRVETAMALADRGIASLIASGETPGLLAAALAGEDVPGTIVSPVR